MNMGKLRRNWTKVDLKKYFQEIYGNRQITRGQLQKENPGFYSALVRRRLLDTLVPATIIRRYWANINLEAYFNEHYGSKNITRSKLLEEDSGLYNILREKDLLDKIIPKIKLFGDPLEYFRGKYNGEEITRSQLKYENSSLYNRLHKDGLLDKAIPLKKSQRRLRDPLAYFNEHYGSKNITRGQLQNADGSLYNRLRKDGLLDKVIPLEKPRRKIGDPLDYFNEHYGSKNITRGELKKEDPSLYEALRQKKLLNKIPSLHRKIGDPLDYFKREYKDRTITKSELRKEDRSLYQALRVKDLLNIAFPLEKPQRKIGDPLVTFREKYKDRTISREKLRKEDAGLYSALRKKDLLDEAIPLERPRRKIGDPLAYFNEHYGSKNITRGELIKENNSLYRKLCRDSLLDKVIPLERPRRKIGDPLAYFNEHYGSKNITRGELKKEDPSLYLTLLKKGLLDQAIPEVFIINHKIFKSKINKNTVAQRAIRLFEILGDKQQMLTKVKELLSLRVSDSILNDYIEKYQSTLADYLGPLFKEGGNEIIPQLRILLVDVPPKWFGEKEFTTILYRAIRKDYDIKFNSNPKKTICDLENLIRKEKTGLKEILEQTRDEYRIIYNYTILEIA